MRNGEEPVLFGGKRGGEWGFLSNFFSSRIEVDGRVYATVEHYYQACKAVTETEHKMIQEARSPGKAKQMGRRLPQIDPKWETVKTDVMKKALLAKFRQHGALRRALLTSGDRAIHEDARYDMEWGWGRGKGKDLLGKLLVQVRQIIAEEFPKDAERCR
jgi:N-glycosidase YbiA